VFPVRYELDSYILFTFIRMVLRPANSIKVFRGFTLSYSKCQVGSQTLHASHAALPMVTSKLSLQWNPSNVNIKILIMRSKAPAQLLSSPLPITKATHFLTLYLLHFLKLYPPSKAPLPEGRAGTAWEPSERNRFPAPPRLQFSLKP
jgi:hypothetical protein